jgi:ATP-dependent Clp protease, protease subunit
MKYLPVYSTILGMAFTNWLAAKETPPEATDGPQAPVAAAVAEVKDPAIVAKNREQEKIAADNKLQAERLVQATNALRAEVTQLKLERELITEKMALEATKRQVTLK